MSRKVGIIIGISLKNKFILMLCLITCLIAFEPCVFAANEVMEPPKVAIVLGGGCARGLSHIGLIKAFEEYGIPIDLIIGVSMGSIIGGLYAAGFSVDNMIEMFTKMDMASKFDVMMPPGGGLFDSKGLQQFLDSLFEGKSVQDFPIPFYPVAVNLGTGKEVVLDDQKASIGIQASMSMPGIFSPVIIDEDCFVDGGLKNMVPANIASDMGANAIIAVNLNSVRESPNYGNIFDILSMSLTTLLDGYTEMNTAPADVLINIELDNNATFDYKRIGYFVDEGYKAALRNMENIKKVILSQDPNYKFTPYKQNNYSNKEFNALLNEAELASVKVPRRFTIKPEFIYDSDYKFPKLGLKFVHGPLKYFGIGYRYGFNPEQGGHEFFIYKGTERTGKCDVYIRLNPSLEKPIVGFSLSSPKSDEINLDASYVSQGYRAWSIIASQDDFLNNSKARFGLSLGLNGLRPKDGNASFVEKFSLSAGTQFEIYPWSDKYFSLGYVLVQPFLLTELNVESLVAKPDPKPSLKFGVGIHLQILGVYPGKAFWGIQTAADEKTKWHFQLQFNK